MHVMNKSKITFSPEAKSYASYFAPHQSSGMSVTLNSLIDIFTILLIFLLKAYSSTGFTMPVTPGLQLPQAKHFSTPEPTTIISVTSRYIAVDGKKIMDISGMNLNSDGGIPLLKRHLIETKIRTRKISGLNSAYSFSDTVTVEGDKNIPFSTLRKIMITCGEAEYSKISLALVNKFDTSVSVNGFSKKNGTI